MNWKSIKEYGYPEKTTRCVVWNNDFMQAQFLVYNKEYQVWDDDEGDDYYDDLNTDIYPAYIEIELYKE